MSAFENPFGRDRGVDHSERVEAIKLWTRETLALPEDSIVSVGEIGCSKPTCPRRQTVILVMGPDAPTRKISIHNGIADISELDVLDACFALLQNAQS